MTTKFQARIAGYAATVKTDEDDLRRHKKIIIHVTCIFCAWAFGYIAGLDITLIALTSCTPAIQEFLDFIAHC